MTENFLCYKCGCRPCACRQIAENKKAAMALMKCESCENVVVGQGFFRRPVHRPDCERMKVLRAVMKKEMGIPDRFERCPLCRENMSISGMMCVECSEEADEHKDA
jgi:hypothetical protein